MYVYAYSTSSAPPPWANDPVCYGHWTKLGLIIINLVNCAVIVQTNYDNTSWRVDPELDCLCPMGDLGSAAIVWDSCANKFSAAYTN